MNDICAKEKIKLAIETKINMLNSIKNNINLKELASFDYNSIENLNQAIDDYLNIGVKLPCLYIIQINKNLELSYVKNKKEQYKKNVALFKINEENFNDKNNKCLYVGSSHNIKKRIKEHLGTAGSNKTYALHLKQWIDDDVKFQIHIFKTEDINLQLFEDLLWDLYKPLLGRKGAK